MDQAQHKHAAVIAEAKAAEKYGAENITSYEYNLAGNAKSSILGTAGSVKAVRVNDGPVVGVHMIGARVGELVGEAQLIVNWEAYPEDVAPFVHGHPTQNETIGETIMEQLRALDGILDSARSQIDVLKGIDTGVKSVQEAIKALDAALLSANQLKQQQQQQQQQQQTSAYLGSGVYHGNGTVTTGSGATVPVSDFVGKTDAARADAYLASNPDVAAAYANGHTSGMTPAGEQGPELINFRNPGQVYTAAQTANLLGGGNTQRLEALVAQLIDDNRRQAGEIARLNARMARVMEKWDGDGMPAARVEAAV